MIQGFGKGSGRHRNKCPHCGQFVKRGLMYNVNHFHEKHKDIAAETTMKIFRELTYNDIEYGVSVVNKEAMLEAMKDYVEGGREPLKLIT